MRFRSILLLLYVFYAFTCTIVQARDEIAPQDANVGTHHHSTLYRIRSHGHTAYLFGTIHVGKPEFYPFEPLVTQALTDATTLALEIDLSDTEASKDALMKYAMYTGDNDTLDKHLSPTTLNRLKQKLAQIGIPYENVARFKVWMVSNLLTVATLEQQGLHAALATDLFLLQTAQTQGKNVVGLETAEFQFSLFDHMTAKQQENYLNDVLNELDSGAALKDTKEMVDAWESADHKAFDALLTEAKNDKTTSGRFVTDVLLNKRNPNMATNIEKLLKQEKVSFVGIGLLHLLGNDGVPQLLARRGYEVTQLY